MKEMTREELKKEEQMLLHDIYRLGYHVEFQHFQHRNRHSYPTDLLFMAERSEGLNRELVAASRAITVAELYKTELWEVFKDACRKGRASDKRPNFPPKIPAIIGVGVCSANDTFDRLRGRVAALERLVKIATKETIHACPPLRETLTPCCGKNPLELPRNERITNYPKLVTCKYKFVHP